jgi:DNA-binding HxlR family transcriptional regulator
MASATKPAAKLPANLVKDKESRLLYCPIRYALDTVTGKWKLPILCVLAHGPNRYNSILRKLDGITNMMLAQSLRELEDDGMIVREQFNEVPLRVEYSLTERGKSLVPLLRQTAKWGIMQLAKEGVEPYCQVCKKTK